MAISFQDARALCGRVVEAITTDGSSTRGLLLSTTGAKAWIVAGDDDHFVGLEDISTLAEIIT